MSKYRIVESNGRFKPQIKIALYENLWLIKTKYEWCKMSRKGETWQNTYEDALSIIEQCKENEKEIYHYID